jgi:hypothetical protein
VAGGRGAPVTEAVAGGCRAPAAEAAAGGRGAPAAEAVAGGRGAPVTEAVAGGCRAPAAEAAAGGRGAPVTEAVAEAGEVAEAVPAPAVGAAVVAVPARACVSRGRRPPAQRVFSTSFANCRQTEQEDSIHTHTRNAGERLDGSNVVTTRKTHNKHDTRHVTTSNNSNKCATAYRLCKAVRLRHARKLDRAVMTQKTTNNENDVAAVHTFLPSLAVAIDS